MHIWVPALLMQRGHVVCARGTAASRVGHNGSECRNADKTTLFLGAARKTDLCSLLHCRLSRRPRSQPYDERSKWPNRRQQKKGEVVVGRGSSIQAGITEGAGGGGWRVVAGDPSTTTSCYAMRAATKMAAAQWGGGEGVPPLPTGKPGQETNSAAYFACRWVLGVGATFFEADVEIEEGQEGGAGVEMPPFTM